ncbi:hypothetical protein Tco_0828612 [Tanacetum coccineum]
MKHNKEKAKMEGSGIRGGMGDYNGMWGFLKKRNVEDHRRGRIMVFPCGVDIKGVKCLCSTGRVLSLFGKSYFRIWRDIEKTLREKRQQIMELGEDADGFSNGEELQKVIL